MSRGPWIFLIANVSYAIVGYTQADLPRFVEEGCKAVDLQPRGQEPPLLVIRLTEAS
jgi:hypothetical protein